MPLPSNSPIRKPLVVCSACGNDMRVEKLQVGKFMITGWRASCDQCKYTSDLPIEYQNTQGNIGSTPYNPPEPQLKLNTDAPKFNPKAKGEKDVAGSNG